VHFDIAVFSAMMLLIGQLFIELLIVNICTPVLHRGSQTYIA